MPESDTLFTQLCIGLLQKEGRQGDGYQGRASPHSDREIFSGLTVKHAEKVLLTVHLFTFASAV